ncbi:MAG: SDR family NAD(P)-dependent oxidoreductase [Acidobacteria bacterium]|nr:SDR family NAD(P)-dependent oxidoreductase [Acidobacteriota bacterium]
MRVSLVTGGGRGIGRAIAAALAGPDTCVAVAGRTRTELDSAVQDLEKLGGMAVAIEMDLTSEASVAAGMRKLESSVDHLDVLVNNAGVGGGEPVAGSDVARWRGVIDTNVTGTYLVTREAIGMIPDGGRIVNISSVLGRFGVPGYTAYCASKHAVIGFTRALALELAPRQITVNALCPGWVNTEMAADGMRQGAAATGQTFEEFRDGALGVVPIQRIIEPEEVAQLVRFVASPAAAAITGQTYNICGGQTMD